MKPTTDNGKCQTLYQLAAEFQSFKEWTRDMFAEREKLSTERSLLIGSRIDAMKEGMKQSFQASEKAIEKAESAQKEYNIRSNEFRAALDDAQTKSLSSVRFDDFRKEYESRHSTLQSEVRTVRDIQNSQTGERRGITATWAIVVSLISLVSGGVMGALLLKLARL